MLRAMQKMTKAEAGRRGGFRRWAKLSKQKRSAHMSKVAKARWATAAEKKEISKQLVRGV